jgi:predicted phage terminase large subunit-like protein
LEQSQLVELYRQSFEDLCKFRANIMLYDAGQDVKLAPTEYHKRWAKILLEGKESFAIEAFRESGKSNIIKAFLLYCLTFPSKNRAYLAIMRENKTVAEKLLKEISVEYQRNPLMKQASCKKIIADSGDAFCVETLSGEIIRIESYGKGTSIRGANFGNRRPDIVILDDIQSKDDMRSESIPNSDWDWFLSDISFLGKATRFFMIGNNLGEKCIIEKIMSSAVDGVGMFGFVCSRVPAIVDNVPTWKDKFSAEYLEKERQTFTLNGKLDIWLMERMCLAVSEETRIFKSEWIKRYDYSYCESMLKDNNNIFCCLDPASSTRNKSCYRAFVIVRVDEENRWHIMHIEYGRWDSVELLEILFKLVRQWKLKEVCIEKGHYQQVIEPFLIKEQSRRNIFFNVKPLEHAKQGSKLERIKMLAPRYKAGLIYHPSPRLCEWVTELETELAGVTKDGIKSEYIDLVDALAMVEQVAEPPVNNKKSDDKHIRQYNKSQQPNAGFGF